MTDKQDALNAYLNISCDVTALAWFEKYAGNGQSVVCKALQEPDGVDVDGLREAVKRLSNFMRKDCIIEIPNFASTNDCDLRSGDIVLLLNAIKASGKAQQTTELTDKEIRAMERDK